ncbi:hypothetical protein C8Q79DRAFT_923408 [Trametes meyenii]|nr:hypothetical protein C8Q79DRAFT_923408 [Trametes meyenii]
MNVFEGLGVMDWIGCITLDNASNCGTMLEDLEQLLRAKGIPFHRTGNRIRCFPHVVNISVQHGLDALTQVETKDAADFGSQAAGGLATISAVPTRPSHDWDDVELEPLDRDHLELLNEALQVDPLYEEALRNDTIECARQLITVCRASGQRREDFANVIMEGRSSPDCTSFVPRHQALASQASTLPSLNTSQRVGDTGSMQPYQSFFSVLPQNMEEDDDERRVEESVRGDFSTQLEAARNQPSDADEDKDIEEEREARDIESGLEDAVLQPTANGPDYFLSPTTAARVPRPDEQTGQQCARGPGQQKGKPAVKSLQLAAAVAKKQQEEREKKTAQLKDMENRQQQAMQRIEGW